VERDVTRHALGLALLTAFAAAACSRASAPATLPVPSAPAATPTPPLPSASPDADPALVRRDAAAAPKLEPASEPVPDAPSLPADEARRLLFLTADAGAPPCATGPRDEQIRCLLAARYGSDPRAAETATRLFDRAGDVAGLSPAETMEGGFRGTLHLVPELPVGARRRHLEWVALAAADFDDFFRRLTSGGGGAPRYRWRALGFRFMRSVGRTTPSAYASGWSVAYNLDGSLNTSERGVRELLFHEIFHLNDEAHGDWAMTALRPTFDAIVRRCHGAVACLAPYAPTATRVRGGSYYAFQENNGATVREYAAELALRYYQEQRAVLRGEAKLAAFKCGPPENGRAWGLLVGEFFGGVDRTEACP